MPTLVIGTPSAVDPGTEVTVELTLIDGQSNAGVDIAVSGGALAAPANGTLRLFAWELTHNGEAIPSDADGAARVDFAWTVPEEPGSMSRR